MLLELPKVIDVDNWEDKSVAMLIVFSCALQLVHYIIQAQEGVSVRCEVIVGPERQVIACKM